MIRDEEIEKASVEYQMSNNPMCIGGDEWNDMIYKMNINPSFIAGAEWADQHPRKGLVDIEKACDAYCKICDTQECFNDGNCNWVKKFRKEMEK